MPSGFPQKIASLAELRRHIPSILSSYGSDENLTRAALANPILALEKIGITFTAEARHDIEMVIRMGEKKAHKLKVLRESIFENAGVAFDIMDEIILKSTVEQLVRANSKSLSKKTTEKPQKGAESGENLEEYLLAMQGQHPVVSLIIEYRDRLKEGSQIASKRQFDAVYTSQSGFPLQLRKVRFLLQKPTK